MNNATLVAHQGWADFFSINALYNNYAKKFDHVIIFVSDEKRKFFLEECLYHIKNIEILVPIWRQFSSEMDTCLVCHTVGHFSHCPRDIGSRCKFIDYSNYPDRTHIKIGAFNNYNKWEKHMRNELSFSHAFFTYENKNLASRIDDFSIYFDESKNDSAYRDIVSSIGKDYLVIHDDISRGLLLCDDVLEKEVPIVNLNMRSETLIDQIGILENSRQLHFIDSSYAVLIYFMSFHNDKIKNIPKFLHVDRYRQRDIGIYKYPTPDNWSIVL